VRHADLFADVEHRRLVAFAFADDNRPSMGTVSMTLAHRFDGDGVRLVPVALPHRLGACDGGLFDNAQKVEREIRNQA
jgi:hypothetical protein